MDMREHSSKPQRLFAKLKLKRNADPDRTYVLVEGNSDYRVWARFKAKVCELIVAHGKDKLLAALRMVNEKFPQWKNVAAIVDADYWLIENADELDTPNLLYDDLPDLEMMLLKSEAYETVMRNTLPLNTPVTFVERLRLDAFRLATEFGYYRLLDHQHREFNLNLRQLVAEEVVDRRTLALKHRRIAESLANKANLNASQLMQLIEGLRLQVAPSSSLCRGRDAVEFLSCIIRFDKDMSTVTKQQTDTRELPRALRLAYDWACFIVTTLYRRIRDWESKHVPHRIIQDYPPERTTP